MSVRSSSPNARVFLSSSRFLPFVVFLLVLIAPVSISAQHGGSAGSGSSVGYSGISQEQHLDIMDMRDAAPPSIKGNTILFTFRESSLSAGAAFTDNTRQTTSSPTLNVKRVAIAFAHEGWRVLHPMTKTNLPPKVVKAAVVDPKARPMWEEAPKPVGAPVFYIYWEMERDTQLELAHEGKNLEYRFVVDGIWMADPLNNQSVRKLNGALVSVIDLSRLAPPAIISPEIETPAPPSATTLVRQAPEQATLTALASSRQARKVTLRWVGEPNQEVYVAGSFNQFDPYLSPLEAIGNDPRHPERTVYQIELRLLAGQYLYYFVINGKPRLDILNPRHGFDAQGLKNPENPSYSEVLVP
jgi:hypothetical protein